MMLPDGLQKIIESKPYRTALSLPDAPVEQYRLLAQGEYNRNYCFEHPRTGETLVLRENIASQMHLADQIGYEYHALKMLEASGRTPKVFYVDGSLKLYPRGVLVMSYLPGHVLDYATEASYAAAVLADIHSVSVPENDPVFIKPKEPLSAILTECEEMFRVYETSDEGDAEKKRLIRHMLDKGWARAKQYGFKPPYRCLINTELNATNFLINAPAGANYLVDWEKPLYGDPAQDLGHFLAPTTTFWKTDDIFGTDEMRDWIAVYIREVGNRFPTQGLEERTFVYIPVTCLRGITWCSMAWVEYRRPDKEISNASTRRKLDEYLELSFLERINRLLDDM